MAALSVDGIPMPALPNSADQIDYNNTTSGLSATTVKGAVDELASEKQDKSDNSLQTTDKTIPGAINELKSGLTNITTALGNVKFAVLDIPNDKTTATLTTTISAQNVVFISPFPCGNNDGYEDVTVDLNSGVVIITKPSASYGGANQHFYLLCAYV